jgi:putative addiction module killer protein
LIGGDRPYYARRVIAIDFMEVQPREIQRYVKSDGQIPFDEWFNGLRDSQAKLKINVRLKRVSTGNFGDYRSVGEGVLELRINFGPGYRVYFGQVATTIVLLLCGGDKSTQDEDIRKAKKYWTKYRSQDNG